MSDDKSQDMINKGRLAQSIEEPFKSAAERVKTALQRRWLDSKDPTERDRIWITMHLADQLTAAIGNIIADGKMAEREIAAIEGGRHKIFSVA